MLLPSVVLKYNNVILVISLLLTSIKDFFSIGHLAYLFIPIDCFLSKLYAQHEA